MASDNTGQKQIDLITSGSIQYCLQDNGIHLPLYTS